MSLTYGFYNSISGDRAYNAEQMSALFEGIIHNGVFQDIGDALAVSEATGMTVKVGTGRAWFNNTWTKNDSDIILAIDPSHVVFHRIDIVVLEINSAVDVRANSIKVIKGTPSSSPVLPALTNAGDIHQYPLAYVTVEAGVTSITEGYLTPKVGTSGCPWVKGVLRNIDTIAIDQGIATLEGLIDSTTTDFNALIDEVEGLIADNVKQYSISTYSNGTYAVTLSPAPSALYVGQVITFKATTPNRSNSNGQDQGSKPTYFNVNSLGSILIKIDGNDLPLGCMLKDSYNTVIYDGTYWNLISPSSKSLPIWKPMTIYVDANSGSDTSGDGTEFNPFYSIQRALDMLPLNTRGYSQGVHNIILKSGTYTGSVYCHGFTNSVGVKFSKYSGATVYLQLSFSLYECYAPIIFDTLDWTGTGYGQAIIASNCTNVVITYCKSEIANGASFQFENSSGRVMNCTFSNKSGDCITAYQRSKVLSSYNNGSGNSVGLRATQGSVIAKDGYQPTATTAEVVSTGGVIR